MDTNQALQQILSNLQKKLNLVNLLYSNTKDMQKFLSSNDVPNFGMMLNKRQENMNLIDKLSNENKRIIMMLPIKLKEKMSFILNPKAASTVSLDNILETNIFDTNKRILVLLKNIMILDDSINKKAKLSANSK